MTTCWTCSGRDVGALQRGLDRDAAELGGVERGQAAAELADGCAGGAEDDGLGHRGVSRSVRGAGCYWPGPCAPQVLPRRHARRATTDAPPTPTPTPSRSASSTARRSPTTSRAACCRRSSTPARPRPACAPRGRPRRGAALGARRPRRARRVRRRARPRRRGDRRSAARASSARARCAGSCRTTSTTRTPPRSSRARCCARYGFDALQVRAARGRRAAPATSSSSPPITTSPAPVGTAAPSSPRPVNAARDLQNAPAERPDADRAARERAQALPRASRVEVWGRDGIEARRDGRVRRRRPGLRRGAGADHAALRRRRARPAPCSASSARRVTFDTGGISIKPAGEDARDEVRHVGRRGRARGDRRDRRARAARPVVAVVGATENMPSGHAIKPGDIVRAKTGTTIEIINTDAEGRLVLADCLAHAVDQGAERLVDIATLTGAIVTALGTHLRGAVRRRRRLGGAGPRRGRARRRARSGGCRCTPSTRRRSRARSPTSSTRSRTARPARSSRPSSCGASPATCRGRTSTSPAPPGTTASPTRPRAARASACGCSSSSRGPSRRARPRGRRGSRRRSCRRRSRPAAAPPAAAAGRSGRRPGRPRSSRRRSGRPRPTPGRRRR